MSARRWRGAAALGGALLLLVTWAAVQQPAAAQEDLFLPIIAAIAPTATATATPSATPTATHTATPTRTATPTSTPVISTATPTPTRPPSGAGNSLRFYGAGRNAIDRVTIRIDAPERPADVGAGEFTVEFWLKAEPGANDGSASCNQNDGWITGNVIVDRDVYGGGDYGDYGIVLSQGRIAFGLSVGGNGTTLCGATAVADSQWHHVAVTRRSNGAMALYVDGQPDGTTAGASGDASYRNGRTSSWTYDPFIVLGAEKHDAGSEYPSFSGWLDELRISTSVRYAAAFAPPTIPFTTDGATAALYHFDEGQGTTLSDTSGAAGGPSNGTLRVGGTPSGPAWSSDSPF